MTLPLLPSLNWIAPSLKKYTLVCTTLQKESALSWFCAFWVYNNNADYITLSSKTHMRYLDIYNLGIRTGLYVVHAWSSRIYQNNRKKYGPQLAEKGTPKKISFGFFHSALINNPWIRFKLSQNGLLTSITIINRLDCCGNRLRNIVVRAGNSNNNNNPVVGFFKGPGRTGGRHVIRFTHPVKAVYVTLQMKGRGYFQINGLKFNEQPASNGKLIWCWCPPEYLDLVNNTSLVAGLWTFIFLYRKNFEFWFILFFLFFLLWRLIYVIHGYILQALFLQYLVSLLTLRRVMSLGRGIMKTTDWHVKKHFSDVLKPISGPSKWMCHSSLLDCQTIGHTFFSNS